MSFFTTQPPEYAATEEEVKNRRAVSRRLSKTGRRYFELIEFDGNEELLAEIRKHPIGLFFIYLTGGLFGVVLATLMIFVATLGAGSSAAFDVSALKLPIIAVCMLLLVITVVMTFISGVMYQSNVIYVTSEKIAQVVYKTIIDRKISQLSIGDVQDVSVTQNGVLARMFNYGTLVIETAGEQQNYTFTHVPYPYQASKAIVGAHEKNVALYGN